MYHHSSSTNNKFITCFHEFFCTIFSQFEQLKKENNLFTGLIVFFSNCWLKKKLRKKIIRRFGIWDWWNRLMNSLKDWTQIHTHTRFLESHKSWKMFSLASKSLLPGTDYGYMMAKSLILCRPNSNPNPK